jgi:uncharacterized protein involved in exopolysaccharide biosynthesis
MSEELKPVCQNDEIDLFELIKTLWEEKLWILLFTFLAAVAGASYVFLATPKYSVSINYAINPSMPVEYKSNIGMPVGEADEATGLVSRVLAALPGWVEDKKQSRFVLDTLVPEASAEYDAKFSDVSRLVSQDLLEQAQWDVEIILNELPITLQSTEAVAAQMLYAKKVLRALSSGAVAIDFGTPSITQIAPKNSSVLALSIVLGGIVGVMFVSIRSAVRNRKKPS